MAGSRVLAVDEFVGLGLLLVGELRFISDAQHVDSVKNVVETFISKLKTVIPALETASNLDSSNIDFSSCASLRLAHDLLIRVDLFWSKLQGVDGLDQLHRIGQTFWPIENLKELEDRLLERCAASK
jgi:hypothetical protein